MWKNKKNHAGYNDWLTNHICNVNHKGSSGSMEAAGAVKMFGRSVERNNLKYTHYIGDGDTSSFREAQASKPYGDIAVEKLECIGHVQKRVGTRCRNMQDQYRGKKLADNKPLTGKGRLAEKAINALQSYYGMAIRQNLHDEYIMRKCIWAALYHNCDIKDENERHQFCPRTEDTRCLWWSDKLTGKNRYNRVPTGPGKSWKVLEFEKCPGKSWNLLIFLKSPGILHNVCPMNFLSQVVYFRRYSIFRRLYYLFLEAIFSTLLYLTEISFLSC